MRHLLVASTVVFLGGCAHAESHAALFREPREPVSTVEVVSADTPVSRPYTELGLVQAFGFGDSRTGDEVLRELRAKAASLGCDGVIRVHVDVGYSRSHGAGVCVRWDNGPGPRAEESTVPMSAPLQAPPPPPTQKLTREPNVRGADQPGATP
jgi:hypothetical protein